MASSFSALASPVITVSYTHLDVYKRQKHSILCKKMFHRAIFFHRESLLELDGDLSLFGFPHLEECLFFKMEHLRYQVGGNRFKQSVIAQDRIVVELAVIRQFFLHCGKLL